MSRLAGASPPAASWRGLDADKWQRGHVRPLVAVALWPPDITALPSSMLCRLDQWARRSTAMPKQHVAVAWVLWQLWHSPATAKLHNAALPSVPASQSQAPFVAATASRPSGEGNRRYAKLPTLEAVAQPSALPGRIRALRAANWLPCGCRGTMALVRRFAQCSGQRPAASHVVCARPPPWPRRCAALALRWSARPPRGLPQPSAWGHEQGWSL
jgi:hypothetical protein